MIGTHRSVFIPGVFICAFVACCWTEPAAYGEPLSGLVGARVTQKRGVVCISDDFVVYRTAHDKGSDHCWKLDYERAVGVVEKIEKGRFAIVRFDTARGWDCYVVNDRAVLRDYWNDELYVVHKAESANFRADENGLLLSGEDDGRQLKLPIRARFPLACISFPPPRFGDRVVRGPDWNKGSADGEAGLEGTIIQRSPVDPSPRGRDGYVTVQWDATRRKGRYRWDYHRKFDVIPANVEQPAAGDGKDGAASTESPAVPKPEAEAVESDGEATGTP
jgi:hypothetical protein